MATTYDYTSTQTAGSRWSAGKFYTISNTVSTVVANGDTIQAIKIPAGTTVCNVLCYIVTVNNAGTTATATVGDGTDPNGYHASVNLAAAIGTRTIGITGTDALVVTDAMFGIDGTTYAAEDTIDLVVTIAGTAPTAGSVKVIALCADKVQ